MRRAVRPDRREPPELLPAGEVADLGLPEDAVSPPRSTSSAASSASAASHATSGTTPVPSQLLPLTASRTTASGTNARTSLVTRTGVMWSAAPGVRSPTSRARPWLWMWYASASPEENVRPLMSTATGVPGGSASSAEAARSSTTGACGRGRSRPRCGWAARRAASRARAPPCPDRRRRCAAGRAPRRAPRAAARTRPPGRARRGARCRGCRARARRRRRAAAAPPRPSRPAARPRRGSCGGQPGGSRSGTSDPSSTYSSAKWREKACAAVSISAQSSASTARVSSPKRSRSACWRRSPRSRSGNRRSSQPQRPEVSAAAVVMRPAGAGTAAARRRSARRWSRTPARSSAGRAGRRRSTARRGPRRTAPRPRR